MASKYQKPSNAEPEAVVESVSVEYPATFTIQSLVNFPLIIPCCRFELAAGDKASNLYFETELQHVKFTENLEQIRLLMGVSELAILTYNGSD